MTTDSCEDCGGDGALQNGTACHTCGGTGNYTLPSVPQMQQSAHRTPQMGSARPQTPAQRFGWPADTE